MSAGEPEIIKVTVAVNSDELREWAGKHADRGDHGVAHVLYVAARQVENGTYTNDGPRFAGEVSDAVAEAAARALYPGYDGMNPTQQHRACDAARRELTAALPHLSPRPDAEVEHSRTCGVTRCGACEREDEQIAPAPAPVEHCNHHPADCDGPACSMNPAPVDDREALAGVLAQHAPMVSGCDEYPQEESLRCKCQSTDDDDLDGWVYTSDGSGGSNDTFDRTFAEHLTGVILAAGYVKGGQDETTCSTCGGEGEMDWPPGYVHDSGTLMSCPDCDGPTS